MKQPLFMLGFGSVDVLATLAVVVLVFTGELTLLLLAAPGLLAGVWAQIHFGRQAGRKEKRRGASVRGV